MAVKDPTHEGNPIAFSERQYRSPAQAGDPGEL